MLAVILRLMKKRGSPHPCPSPGQGRVRSQSGSQSPTLMVIGAEKDVLKASEVLSYTCTPVFSACIWKTTLENATCIALLRSRCRAFGGPGASYFLFQSLFLCLPSHTAMPRIFYPMETGKCYSSGLCFLLALSQLFNTVHAQDRLLWMEGPFHIQQAAGTMGSEMTYNQRF